MKKSILLKSASFIAILVLLVASLSGCSNRPTPTPEATLVPPTPEATATSTVVPARIILLDPDGVSAEAFTTVLSDFAAANALGFETWTSMTGSLEGVKIMVIDGALDNLSGVAAAAPQTQFLVVSQAVGPAANISTLSNDPIHLAFMAGFLAAMTSEDWRAGALVEVNSTLDLSDAFINGGQYLCGRCTPQYSPMLYYPQVYTVLAQSDATAWSAQASALLMDTAVNSIYINGAGDIPQVLDNYPNAVLIGDNPKSAYLPRYAAILGVDVANGLQQVLPDLLAGNGGKNIIAKVALVAINNENIVTPAKQTLFNQVAQDLADNLIIPNSIP